MKIIYGKSGSGKTKKLIEMSLNNDIPILAKDYDRAEHIRELSASVFGKICKVFTLKEFYLCKDKILIDKADELIGYLTNKKIEGISITGED